MSPADDAGTNKIRSIADLQRIKERTQQENALREDGYHVLVTVHMGTCGIASGSRAVLATLVDELADSGRLDVRVTTSGCIGLCEREPVMTVETIDHPKVIYGDLDVEKAREIWSEQVMSGKLVQKYIVGYGTETN
jgi:NADP-reducing hydrogenase subunit HndB